MHLVFIDLGNHYMWFDKNQLQFLYFYLIYIHYIWQVYEGKKMMTFMIVLYIF